MFNRTFKDTVRAMHAAAGFATLMRRRGGLVDEASARPTALDGMMRQAYAEATMAVAEKGRQSAAAPARARLA